ncbi:hypothetical protein RPIT_11345 [Tessaracoccus flavus]|uniref:Uncharacterized protein n=1 Tax=Tessaracoccus flavus TaxID=1610493 RepID=A0A1Q2CJ45_9ACTN|nr:hypothetical protein RPIT_11345 [Tessaracoccus flavus]SDY49039.1 Ribosomal protein S18 acetylase RimI [Tessaracoccus flavus]
MGQATIRRVAPSDPDVATLLDEYFSDRAATWAGEGLGYQRRPANLSEGVILLVDVDGSTAGIGGLRHVPSDSGSWWEVKHMYIRPAARRSGLGRALIDALEAEARRLGATDLVLDTHHSLVAAVSLYEGAGFRATEAFNDNPNATRWFRKPLLPRP